MAAEAKEKEKLARGVVARGRTVRVPHPTEKTIVSTNPETGKPVWGAKVIEHGPGEEVLLPESEIATFRELGFLIDPGKPIIPADEGTRMQESS